MLYVIDNYDSFVFNLVHYVAELGIRCEVLRNDQISADTLLEKKPSALLLSPGPCTPDQAGICLDVVRKAPDDLPILGVCLGHQSIAQAHGAKIVAAREIRHGKISRIEHDGAGLFAGLPPQFNVTRYHSLAVEPPSLPDCFHVDAKTQDGEIMALRHKQRPHYGLQFHPESIASQYGHQLLHAFLSATPLKHGLREPPILEPVL